jgi:hypothetical protein
MKSARLPGWLIGSLALICGCPTQAPPSTSSPGGNAPETLNDLKGPDAFLDVTESAFADRPQSRGWPALAAFDYDNDGDVDIYLTAQSGVPNQLFRNDGSGSFTDVADQAGVTMTADDCVCTGVGDFDNDGLLDLIVGRQGAFGNRSGQVTTAYLHNLGPDGDGMVRFEDVTEQTGLERITFASSIGVADIDNDGRLDLYIGRYDFRELVFRFESYMPDTPNVLLRNAGAPGGIPVFDEVPDAGGTSGLFVAGLAPDTVDMMTRVPTWAVYLTDVNLDGLQDIFALKELPGWVELYLNNGDLTFTAAQTDLLSRHGGWMGLAAADYDRDGFLDYFLTNVGADADGPPVESNHVAGAWRRDEGSPYHMLLRNDGTGRLVNVTADIDVTPGPLPPTNELNGQGLAAYEFGFGCAWLDADNDGWPDLSWAGDIVLAGTSDGPARRDFNGVGRFLRNTGGGFTDQTGLLGLFNWPADLPAAYGYSRLGRAQLSVDLTSDGFADLLRTNRTFDDDNAATFAFRCLINPAAEANNWIIIRLQGTTSNRFGIGAKVRAEAAGTVYVNEVVTTTSAFSATHPQVHFGLGGASRIDTLTVQWPSGLLSELSNVEVNQLLTITEP